MSTYDHLQIPPPPTDPAEVQRVQHTRLRRRMLYGQHEEDVRRVVIAEHGPTSSQIWGAPDMSANVYLSIWQQVAVLHSSPPIITPPVGSENVAEAVADAGWWSMAQRVQRDTLGMREMLVRLDFDAERGQLLCRPVYPDMVDAESHPRRPAQPTRIRERICDPILGWLVHDVDVRNPDMPIYVVTDTHGADVTEQILGASYSGDAYPYRDRDGTPILPYVMIHAASTGYLWDTYTMREVVENALKVCVLLTYWGHIVYNASYAQRWAMGAEPVGSDVVDADGDTVRREVRADPASLLMLRQAEGATNATVGQFTTPTDPATVLESIAMYERRALLVAGLSAPDVTRVDATILSGYSLAVSRDDIRTVQRQYEPQFRAADQEILRLAACMINRATGSDYSEDARAYRIQYTSLPYSPQEMRAELDKIQAQIYMGISSPVDAWLTLNPGATRAEAMVALLQVKAELALLAAADPIPQTNGA